MKVFKLYTDIYFYAFSAETEQDAKNEFIDQFGESDIKKIEEIPETEWNLRNINMWEDNDLTKKPFKVSINDLIIGNDPQLVFTNDMSIF